MSADGMTREDRLALAALPIAAQYLFRDGYVNVGDGDDWELVAADLVDFAYCVAKAFEARGYNEAVSEFTR